MEYFSNGWTEDLFELTARYDRRKSFYGKAIVKELRNVRNGQVFYTLYSYGTKVAEVDAKGVYHSYGKWSQTTSRHQKEFERQFAREWA